MRLHLKLAPLMLLWTAVASGQNPPVPPENSAMPPREAIHDFALRAQRLVSAIDAGKADDVKDLFFPKDAFAILKDIKGAMTYYEQLVGWYGLDIAREHEAHKGPLTFVSFRTGPCVWKKVGSEYNKIPYWSCYRNKITVKDAGQKEIVIPIKTMINWGSEWYITHMGPMPKS